jgi:NAD-dependent deacetylase
MPAQEAIEKAIELLRRSRSTIALTGAGISTPSGIPDFRSPTSGMWQNANPLEVASLASFLRRPQAFYDWIYPLAEVTLRALPNPAHFALAALEAFGPLTGVVTQNIDALHTHAGSKQVYEVHGHLREVHCVQCQRVDSAESYLTRFIHDKTMPRCTACGGFIKPRVILFGEQPPRLTMRRAEDAVRHADLILVAGTSLEVFPVAALPALAQRTGARLIIVNYEPTHMDHAADVVIHDDVATVLPALARAFEDG